VEFFEDENDFAPDDLRAQAVTAAPDHEGDGPLLSFDLARSVEDLDVRQQLLLCRSEADRLRLLVEYFPAQKVREGYRSHMQTLAGRNGHGKKGPNGIS
jgi:hypothetical protein